MLRVWLSNDQTELALAAGALLEPDPLERALAGATVVVPDRVLGTFFEDALTRRDGACAGLDLLDLEALCARLLAEADPPRRLVDADLLRGLLVDALADLADLDDPDLAPVRDYLAPDPGRAGALAGLLARRFLSYDRERPDLLRAWREAPPADPVARWQRALFLRALDALARLEARRPDLAPALTLGQLARDPAALDGLPVPPRLVVFVGPTLAPVEAALLARLAERTEVDLFAHTPRVPCAELAPPGVGLAALPPLAAPGPPPEGPLAAWLQADHARVEALIALAGRDPTRVRGRFRLPAGDGVLARLQRALLLGRTDAGPSGDGSLTTSSFTGKRAEVEQAAGRVLALLAADDAPPDTASPDTASPDEEPKSRPVQLHELALLVPAGLDAYRPLIASVFGAAGLPVRFLAGAPDDRLVEACEALLALVGDPCPERPALAAVLTHPAVLLRAGLGRAEVVRWLDDLPVRLGLDRAQQAGTYLDDAGPDLFHACGGARRLVLGAFCEGERVDEERLVSLEGEACAPLDVAQDQRPAAARFTLLVASLTADVRAAAGPRPLAAWGAWLAALVGAYLAPADDGEEALLERLQRRLRRLGADDDAGAPAVPFAVAAACARDVLGDLRRGGSRHLAGGVLVAERLPPLPLRQVQVLGLDDGVPAREARDGLDLRGAPGLADATAARAAQAALLAALTGAREVHLSHVDVDDRGDDAPPSPLLDDVERALRLLAGPAAGEPWRTRRPAPLDHAPRARGAAAARALRADLVAHLGVDAPPPLERLRAAVGPEARAAVDAALGLAEVPPAPPGGRDDALEVTFAELRRFLHSPLQETARRAGLAERAEADDDSTEPLEVSRLDLAVLLRDVFVRGWNAAVERGGELEPALVAAHDALLEREERLGRRVPTRAFLAAARRAQREVLRAWGLNLRGRLEAGERQRPLRHLRLGGVASPGAPDEVAPALELSVDLPGELPGELPGDHARRVTVRVTGRLPLLLADRSASVSLGTSPGWSEAPFVEGALAHVVLAAAGLRDHAPFRAFHVCPEWQRAPWKPVALAAVDPAEARAYLADLVCDLLVGQWTLLPLEAVLAFQSKGLPSLRDKVLELRDAEFGRGSFRYGPLGRPGDFAPPDEAAARALAERRLGLYRALRRQAEEAGA